MCMYVCMSVCARACVHVWARACMCVRNFSPLRHYAKDGKKLHSIAATKTMRSTTSKRLLSMTPSRQRNYFRCPVALSTCIQSAAIVLVAITSWGSICWRLSRKAGMFKQTPKGTSISVMSSLVCHNRIPSFKLLQQTACKHQITIVN